MDYFNNVFTTFLGLESGCGVALYGGIRKLFDFIKILFICVMKINKVLMGLEPYKGE